MSRVSRRLFVATGVTAAVAAAGAAITTIGRRYGLVPPDAGGIYGPGETLWTPHTACLAGTRWRASSRARSFGEAVRQFDGASDRRVQATSSCRLRELASRDQLGMWNGRCRFHWQTCARTRCVRRSPKSPARKAGHTSPNGPAHRSPPCWLPASFGPHLATSSTSRPIQSGGRASTSTKRCTPRRCRVGNQRHRSAGAVRRPVAPALYRASSVIKREVHQSNRRHRFARGFRHRLGTVAGERRVRVVRGNLKE